MKTKICKICEDEKPIDDFYFRTYTKQDGEKSKHHRNECIKCWKKINRKYRVPIR